MVFPYSNSLKEFHQFIFILSGFLLTVQNCPTVYTTEPGVPSDENVASTSSSSRAVVSSSAFQNTRNQFPHFLPEFWNLMNGILDRFVERFQSLHETTVLIDRKLKSTYLFEAGEGMFNGAFRLEFRTRPDNARSSVFVQVPSLGLMYNEGIELSMYDRETFMYDRILPAIHKAWPLEALSPICYVSGEAGILVVQNLRELGFHTTRRRVANPVICGTVFLFLARFHALSRIHLDAVPKDGTALSSFNVMDRGKRILEKATLHALLRKFRTRLTHLLPTRLEALFEDMVSNVRTIVHVAHVNQAFGFNVILHGNANHANIFLSNARDVTNLRLCKFVNFQNSRLGPPVIDLITYVLTSVEFTVFQGYQDSLFANYLTELNTILREWRSDDPRSYTEDALRADLRKYKLFFVYQLAFNVPMHWLRFAGMQTTRQGQEDEYDRLLKDERFITFFKNWMEVFLSW